MAYRPLLETDDPRGTSLGGMRTQAGDDENMSQKNEYDCGCTDIGRPWGSETTRVSGLCLRCKAARIGEEIDFARYGDAPERSYNHRDDVAEEGVSVYELIDGEPRLVGWYFEIILRQQYRGRGVIVGWGSDGEPLVKILSIAKV